MIPRKHWLWANYPNPFNAWTVIPFELAFSGRVRLGVYDVLGRKVRVVVDQDMGHGRWEVGWDGRDDLGHPAASGRYLYRLQVSTFSDSKTMTLIR